MEYSLNCLIQTLIDIQLRAKQETMGYCRTTILDAEHATEYMISARSLADIVTHGQRHESDLKDASD
jgi:hypothetical protein